MTFIAEQKLQAIRREIRWRSRVYPNRLQTGRMSQKEADYELAVMGAIEADYEKEADKERLL
jgi:hypothetical protein